MKNYTKQLKFNSLRRNILQAEQFVEEICDENYILNSFFGNIMLAIEEAVKNAILHGNKQEYQKLVTLTFQRKKSGLHFIIKDEGEGFNHQDIPNPLDTDDASGNGIFLMRSLADKVCYNSAGNQVELIFTVTSINQETTLNRISQLKKYFNQQKSLV